MLFFKIYALILKIIALVFKIIDYVNLIKLNYIHYWLLAEKSIYLKKRPLIVEIGAHIGNDTEIFLNKYNNTEIIAFEPDPRNFLVLKKRFKTNKNVKLYNYALSNMNGKKNFYLNYEKNNKKNSKKNKVLNKFGLNPISVLGSSSSSLLYPSHLRVEKINVNVRRLDSIEELKNRNIFLTWIDVQGAERLVLDGSNNYIFDSELIWIEYGETGYPTAMSREETIDRFKNSHHVIEQISNHSSKGNILLKKNK
jgi:FkbM family methyltransferase